MQISNCHSLRWALLLWMGLLCGMTSFAAGAQESAASSSASLSVENESSSGVSMESDAEPGDRWNRHWDRHWNRHRNAHDHELVSIGHDSTLAAGERANTVVSIFGSSTSEGQVNEDVVSVLGNTHVTGPVGGDVVAVLGNVYVNSKVNRDVVAVLGNIELGPQADIEGKLVAVGGNVLRDPQAIVRGRVQDLSFGIHPGGFAWLQPWLQKCLLYGRLLAIAPGLGWAWLVALISLLSYVLSAWLAPRALDRCVATLEEHPGHSLLAALLASLATPILFLLLVITVIGIVAIPFLGIALLCLAFFGKLAMLAWLGRRLVHSLNTGTPAQAALATLIGGMLVTALYCVPVLGFLVYKLLGFVGFGVVVYTLILNNKNMRQQGSANAGTASSAAQPQAPETGDAATTAANEPSSAEGTARAAPYSTIDALSLPRASFWMRMGALLVDVVLVAFVLNLIYDSHHMLLLSLAIYGALLWKFRGTTIGGILFNLRIVRLDGRELDWATVIVRALSCFLSLIVAGLGFIWILIDDDKQAWHDKIAGTVVVRAPKGVPLV